MSYGIGGLLGNLVTSVATPAVGGIFGDMASDFFTKSIEDEAEKQLLKEITQTTIGALSGAAVGAGLGALTGGGGAGALSGALTGGVGGGLGGYNAQDISQMFGATPPEGGTMDAYGRFLKKNFEPLLAGTFLGSSIGAVDDTSQQAEDTRNQSVYRNMLEAQRARNFSRSIWGMAEGGPVDVGMQNPQINVHFPAWAQEHIQRSGGLAAVRGLDQGPQQAQKPWERIHDLNKYAGLSGDNDQELAKSTNFRPLNFDALLSSGAMRVTNTGTNTGLPGGYNTDPKSGFSLVSAYNDAAGDATRSWPDNPDMYAAAKSLMQEHPEWATAHKYQQIVKSAQDLGLSDKDIYLNYAQGGYINTEQVNPNNFYPQSQIPKAQPYLAATPIRHEVLDNYAHGGLINGAGDGMSDDINANISGQEPVKVADGEYVVPKEIAAQYGPERLRAMMTKVRAAAHAKKGKQIQQDAGKRAFISALGGVKA